MAEQASLSWDPELVRRRPRGPGSSYRAWDGGKAACGGATPSDDRDGTAATTGGSMLQVSEDRTLEERVPRWRWGCCAGMFYMWMEKTYQ